MKFITYADIGLANIFFIALCFVNVIECSDFFYDCIDPSLPTNDVARYDVVAVRSLIECNVVCANDARCSSYLYDGEVDCQLFEAVEPELAESISGSDKSCFSEKVGHCILI